MTMFIYVDRLNGHVFFTSVFDYCNWFKFQVPFLPLLPFAKLLTIGDSLKFCSYIFAGIVHYHQTKFFRTTYNNKGNSFITVKFCPKSYHNSFSAILHVDPTVSIIPDAFHTKISREIENI